MSGSFFAGCTDRLLEGNGASFRANITGDLRVYFLDVGQGDSSVLLFKDKVILIDAGDVDRGDRVVSDLQNLGVTSIDLLVATHPHSDHIGGMREILASFPVERVLDPGLPSTSVLYEHFLETIDRKKIPYMIAEQGQTLDIDPLLRIRVLSPPKERIGDDLNTNSIVLLITYGKMNLLFTGDATTAAEDNMEKAGCPLDAQVLKVGHHGSYSSSSPAFISRVRPECAVISLGTDNPYGYPHRDPLQRLQEAHTVIYRTDSDGTILVRSDGVTYSVVTEKNGGNIWSYSGTGAGMPGPEFTRGTTSPTIPSATFTLPVTLPAIPSTITVPEASITFPLLQIGNASGVYISAVQFNAPGNDTENLNGEWVRLTNGGDGAVLLTSWTLSDRNSAEPYRFPAFLLLPQSSVTVYTGRGEMNDTSLYWGRSEPVWGNSGDLATLKDGSGTIIDRKPEMGLS